MGGSSILCLFHTSYTVVGSVVHLHTWWNSPFKNKSSYGWLKLQTCKLADGMLWIFWLGFWQMSKKGFWYHIAWEKSVLWSRKLIRYCLSFIYFGLLRTSAINYRWNQAGCYCCWVWISYWSLFLSPYFLGAEEIFLDFGVLIFELLKSAENIFCFHFERSERLLTPSFRFEKSYSIHFL